jgi:uncharacterized protein YkwD
VNAPAAPHDRSAFPESPMSRPHPPALRRRIRLAAAAALALGIAGCVTAALYEPPALPAYVANLDRPGAAVDAAAAARLISAYRRANGLGAVGVDPVLSALARRQAAAEAAAGHIGHAFGGQTLDRRAEAAGYDYAAIAENVAANYPTLRAVFMAWQKSSEHRANMLMPRVTSIGIAVVQAPQSRFRTFWALELGARRRPPPTMAATPFGAAVKLR